MTTETRIGIVAGLLIVVAASVYFFYGSEKDEDGVLVATPTRVTVPPKIPVSADKKAAPQRVTRAPARSPSTPGPLANNFAQRRPPMHPIVQPGQTATPQTPYKPPVRQPDAPVSLRTGPSAELVEATWDNLLKRDPSAADAGKPSGAANPAITSPVNRAPTPSPAPRGAPRVIGQPTPAVTTPTLSSNSPPVQRPIAPPVTTSPKRHTVAAGDTLSDISKQYYGDSSHAAEILAANPQIKSARSLKIGDVLTLPEAKSETILATSPSSAEPAAESPSPATTGKSYTVQSGDTLYSIAKKQCGSSTRWKEIQRLNKDVLKGNSRLSVGMVLKLPE